MLPSFVEVQIVTVDLDAYRDSSPKLGDVVVFNPPAGADRLGAQCGSRVLRGQVCAKPTAEYSELEFIKRVAATPRDTFAIEDGDAFVNGGPAVNDSVLPCRTSRQDCDFPIEVTIPPGHYFMLGDNCGVSSDSRFWGPVPIERIIGKVED